MTEVELRPVRAEELSLLGELFACSRQTRHCWCMAFCSTSLQFAAGWYGGGNRRRFTALARTETEPMGLLACRRDRPIGWCACGPRARYCVPRRGRSSLARGRPPEEDERVWLIACTIIRPDEGAANLMVPLIRGAVALARERGAEAIEAWPLAQGLRLRADAHLGREGIFRRLGFTVVERPSPQRVIMRRALS